MRIREPENLAAPLLQPHLTSATQAVFFFPSTFFAYRPPPPPPTRPQTAIPLPPIRDHQDKNHQDKKLDAKNYRRISDNQKKFLTSTSNKRLSNSMGFVKYKRDLKVIAVKMSRRGMTLAEINAAIDKQISPDSLSRWNRLYEQTRDVVRNPALYLPRGRPLAFTTEQREFVLEALEAEPALYVDEIQSHIVAMTGVRHPLRTILDELKIRLHLTKKVARTVHPAQCEVRRAAYIDEVGIYPSTFFVFLDECAVSKATHSRD
ncbi:hypothetical protein PCASD_18137 [Puccinia coronata f. sp. avenae]|uniref:Uncharacterized protein n=1 Tax=Puccinia coronata f. sp. avenae TaxID=200324 RepID=A0A2N5SVB8_9BASI|nr:hypothetical protein PCASD_18137 [Puccinia coronata f. sp. avenae]